MHSTWTNPRTQSPGSFRNHRADPALHNDVTVSPPSSHDAAIEMTGPTTHTAMLGTNSQIPCTFTSDKRLVYSSRFTVIWYRDKKAILSSIHKETYNESKYSLNMDKALKGTANLTIFNISMADSGSYTCAVSYELRVEKSIKVDIQAPPRITIVNNAVMTHKVSFLCCEISGFYPVDINIKWFRDGEILDNVLEGNCRENTNGTYSVNSSIILTPTEEDRGRSFSCRVEHVSLLQPLKKDFTLEYGAPPRITIVNNAVVTHKMSFLCCEISGFYPVDINIKWFREGEILDNVLEGKPRKNPNGTYSVNSSIILTPTDEDRGLNFSCRVEHVSLLQPLKKDFTLEYGGEKVPHTNEYSKNAFIVAISILSSICVILAVIILCLWWKKNHKKETRPTPEGSKTADPNTRKPNLNVEEENEMLHMRESSEESHGLRQRQSQTNLE